MAGEPHVIKSSAHIGVLSTPKGQRGFFWTRIFDPDVETKYTKHIINWREVVDVLIPIISVEQIKKMEIEDPVTYEQEMDNKFLLSEERGFGDFPEEDFEAEVI